MVEALRRTRRATASTGPFVDVELRDGRIEVVAQAPAWMPLDRLRILQGPPGTNGNRTFASLRPGEGVEERVEGGLRVWRGSLEPNRGTAGLPAPRYVLVVAESEAMMEPWMDCPAFAITNPVGLGPPPAGAAR